MIFERCRIPGTFLLRLEPQEDERGYFARTFCEEEFRAQGVDPRIAQTSVSFNTHRHTMRGLHFQAPPHGENKVVRCSRGAIWDVVVDMRPDSPTSRQWWATQLSAETGVMLYIPEGCAHGFLTLEPSTEVAYQMSVPYEPASARGIRWDDPTLSVEWPYHPQVMSDRDRALPLLRP